MGPFRQLIRPRMVFIAVLSCAAVSAWAAWLQPRTVTHTSTHWDLGNYRLDSQQISIQGIEDNLSGITYHPATDQLYAISNDPTRVYVLDKQGTLLRHIDLIGFDDTEGISHVNGNTFVIVEERRRALTLIDLPMDATTVDRQQGLSLDIPQAKGESDNKGLEGVTWSNRHGLFTVQETPPRLLHQPAPDALSHADRPLPGQEFNSLDVRDYADIALLPGEEERLLVLSEASHSLHVVDLTGRELSRLNLRSGLLNLIPLLEQPEGVTIDNDGNVYLVGEPNQFMVLPRKSTSPIAIN